MNYFGQFRRLSDEALGLYEQFSVEVMLTAKSCNDNRDIETIQRHFRAAEDFQRQIVAIRKQLLTWYSEKTAHRKDKDKEQWQLEQEALLRMFNSTHGTMYNLMHLMRPWLAKAQYELRDEEEAS